MIIQSVLLQLMPLFAGVVTGGFTIFGVRRTRRRKVLAAAAREEQYDTKQFLKDEDHEYFETWDRILNIYTEPVKPPKPTPKPIPATAPTGAAGQAKASPTPGELRQIKRNEEWLTEQNRKALSSIAPHADVGARFPIYISTDLEVDWGVLGHEDLRPRYARGTVDKIEETRHEIEETRNKLAAAKRELKLAKAEARAQIQDHVDAIAAMKSIVDDVISVHRDGQAIIIPEDQLEVSDYPLLTSDDIDEEIARLDQLRRRSEQLKNRSSVLVNLLDPVTKQPIAVPMSDAICENGVWRMRELPGVDVELFDRMDGNLISSTRIEIYQRDDGEWRAKNWADRWMNKYRITPRSTDS